MSLSIRPVTRRFPASFELWEETNLPLAVVLQPLDTTHEQQEQETGGSAATTAPGAAAAATVQQQSPQSLPLLSHIPKCLHCGAPHPDARTHYAPPPRSTKDHSQQAFQKRGSSTSASSSSSVLLCYLCGKLSSTRLEEQVMARRGVEEDAAQQNAQQESGNEQQYHRLPLQTSHTFALPLRLSALSSSPPPSMLTTSNTAWQPHLVYTIPAMSCPPLWFWILDGTATDRSYWHVVSETLQTSLAQLPPFCHVALLLACRQDRGVGIFKLDSATPHVKYYPYATVSSSFSTLSQQNHPVPSHAHDGRQQSNGRAAAASAASSEEDNQMAVLLLRQRIMQSLVPCDGSHRDHIQAALRSLLDVHSLVESDTVPVPSTTTSAADPSGRSSLQNAGMPLAELLTHLSEAFAGQKPNDNSDMNLLGPDNGLEQDALLPYAGGKVTVFLANRPADLPHHIVSSYYNSYLARDDAAALALSSSSLYTYGGWGGRTVSRGGAGVGPAGVVGGDYLPPHMAPPQNPFYSSDATNAATDHVDEKDEQDLEKLADFFAELGRQCADAAMGVDILGLVSSLTNGIDNQDKDLGLVVLGGLSYKSGAAGPLLFDLHQAEARRNLAVEVASRSPWIALNNNDTSSSHHTPHQRVFGAELRLRLSRGFTVDDAAIEPPPPPPSTPADRNKKKKQVKQKQRFYDGFDDDNGTDNDDKEEEEDSLLAQPFLACLHGEKGLMGPACAVPDEDSLWRMGTCDPYTAFSIDLDMAGSSGGSKKNTASTIPQDVMVDGWGRIPLKAVMQTCFSYTAIIKGNDDDDEYYTVRRIKISSCPVPLAHDAETIYNAVDPEATAVILFHKLTVACFQEGLQATRTIATDWLQSLLTCVYRSAETQAEIEFEMKESGIDKNTSAATTIFLPSERLLHQDGGTLSDDDVLLAQGHARLKAFPLMIYLLLQCDAFRRHQEFSSTAALSSNMDLRYAALYQMAHMTPDVLMRCIAPILQLWSAASATENSRQHDHDDGDEPILEIIDLRASAVHQSIKEYSNSPFSSSLILFMDSPYQMLLLNAKAILSTQEDNTNNGGSGSSRRGRQQPTTPVVGPALATAVQQAASRYRTRPPMMRALDINSSRANESVTTRAVQHIWDACLEDVASEGETFAQWKSNMAKQVHKELQEEDYHDDGEV